MSSQESRTNDLGPNLDTLFNGEIRQFAEVVRDTQQTSAMSHYPTRNEINRQIMDATRPLLDQIAELTRMVSALVEPRTTPSTQGQQLRERDNPLIREGNESFPNSHRMGSRSDSCRLP